MWYDVVRRHGGAGLVVLTVLLALPSRPAHAQEIRVATTAATLTIVVSPVEHVPSGKEARHAAADGMNLAEGDRVITGSRAIALVTFLDGSTITVQPDSDVVIARAAVATPESTGLRILIRAGKVWARVARLLGRRSSISLESNEYAATARDGLIGAERAADGTFVCWTRAGEMTVAGRDGPPLARLSPGEKATVGGGARGAVETFRVHVSALEIEASANLLPLLQAPESRAAAGFVAPGIEVNQIFGSRTEREDEAWRLDVPAGESGVYTLVLTGLADGPFSVSLVGTLNGAPVYRHRIRGVIARGQQFIARLEPRFEDTRDGQDRSRGWRPQSEDGPGRRGSALAVGAPDDPGSDPGGGLAVRARPARTGRGALSASHLARATCTPPQSGGGGSSSASWLRRA